MSRVERIRGEFVEFIPETLESGVVYISRKYKTASHLCCCGCGNKVVTPLKPGGWHLTTKRSAVTLDPSIGSWSLPCQSHYWIRANKIVWAPKWSKNQIKGGWINDQVAREQHFDAPPQRVESGIWQRFINWILGILGFRHD